MADFTAGGIHGLPTETRSIGDVNFDQRIHELVHDWGCAGSCSLIQEMIVTALKMGKDNLSVADLKLFNRALKELRYAARVFEPYADRRKVVVFGSARTPRDTAEFCAALEFGRKMRERGYMIITGGGDGIMGAAQEGAGRDDSFGLNIKLPFEQRANEVIHGDPKLINFNYFFTRKLNFVKETHAVALFPGGFGTMDEGFEVLTLMQTGKARILPLVFVDKPGGTYWKTFFAFVEQHLLAHGLVSPEDFNFFRVTTSVDEAVEEILQFYKNFRSYRWVGKKLVIRMDHPLTDRAIAELNREFSDLIASGKIERSEALPEELNQPEIAKLPRLVLTPNRRNFGRARALIDAVNRA
ncbi:MAG: TIGR00730 family Rossman fold protein [Verrucomicrobiota bacterium]